MKKELKPKGAYSINFDLAHPTQTKAAFLG